MADRGLIGTRGTVKSEQMVSRWLAPTPWPRRALLARPGVKVVFVSGYAEDQIEDGSIAIPNAVFLPKPFSLADLTETVQRQLH